MTGIAHQRRCDIPGPSYPSLRQARFTQMVVACIGLFSTMDIQVVGLFIEPMKQDLALTDTQIGLAQATAFYAVLGLFAIPMGMLADRLIRVRLLLVALLLGCVGLALVGFSHTVWLLAMAKAMMGLSSAMTVPAALSLIADSFAPDRRAFATASYTIGTSLGQVFALLAGGFGYNALVAMAAADPNALAGLAPWRVVSLISAAMGLMLILLILKLREPARMETRKEAGTLHELWAYRDFLIPLGIGVMCLQGTLGSISLWFAPVLMRLHHLQPSDFALPASLIMLVSSLGGVAAAGKLINFARARGGDQAVTIPAAIAAALCVPGCFAALAPGLWTLTMLGVIFLFCAGIGIVVPVIFLNFRLPNELRGLCMGAYVVVAAVSGMVGAPLVGFVAEMLGGGMMLGHALAIVGAPLCLISTAGFLAAARRGTDETRV